MNRWCPTAAACPSGFWELHALPTSPQPSPLLSRSLTGEAGNCPLLPRVHSSLPWARRTVEAGNSSQDGRNPSTWWLPVLTQYRGPGIPIWDGVPVLSIRPNTPPTPNSCFYRRSCLVFTPLKTADGTTGSSLSSQVPLCPGPAQRHAAQGVLSCHVTCLLVWGSMVWQRPNCAW